MFAAIFAVAFITVHVTAEIPSYIHVCGRRDPNFEQCILNNVNNLKSKICEGIPDLDIPSNDPFIVDNVILFDTPNMKLYIRDAKITGLCDFDVNYFHSDFDNLHYDVEIVFDQLRANASYEFDIRILIPISHKGNLYITTDNVEAKVGLDFLIVTTGGKRFTYLAKMKINLDLKDYNDSYDVDEQQFDQLHEIIHNFAGRNKEEVLKSLKPALEKAVSDQVIAISNGIVKHFTYEELFPERT